MRITVLGKYFPEQSAHDSVSGGIETATFDAAKALSREHDVTVIANGLKPGVQYEAWPEFTVVRCGVNANIASQPISVRMIGEIARSKPEVIHLHGPNYFASAVLLLLFPRVPVVLTHHMEIDAKGRRLLNALGAPWYRFLARRARKVIASTPKNYLNSEAIRDLRRPPEIIPYGVDEVLYRPDSAILNEAAALRRSLGLEGPVVGFLGRLVYYKGVNHLLVALKETGLHALIVGAGPLEHELRDQASALGLQDRVHLIGAAPDHRSKLAALYAMDIFTLPSSSPAEAFGIVQIEAQLCGLPIVVSDLETGVTDVTIDGETGLWAKTGSATDLADKLSRLAKDEPLRRKLGESGRRRALSQFTLASHETAYLRVFSDVVSERGAA